MRTRNSVLQLLKLLILLSFLFFLSRTLFAIINRNEFNISSGITGIKLFIAGIRFDLSAIFYTNLAFLMLCLIPLPVSAASFAGRLKKTLFIVINSITLLLNCIDIAYYPFVHKRMSADAILFLSGKKGDDFFRMMPVFLADYWFVWLFYLTLIGILTVGYSMIMKGGIKVMPIAKDYGRNAFLIIIIAGVSVVAIRGGLQKKPLNLIHAADVADVSNVPVVLNSVFSVIRTYSKKSLQELHYFPEGELSSCDKGIHTPAGNEKFTKQNVLVIVVESLSKSYLGFFGGPAKTPFIDSVFSQSLVYENGFANAKESIQGIPAVLSSIPSLQEDPFIFSKYSNNKITSLASVLSEENYSTLFFHAGGNGTMGFDSYCKLAGFEAYYGREEYNNDADFDGSWGIWDEPFLQFTAEKLSKTPKPFAASVFTLNTHHPFEVPKKYKNRFKMKNHPIIACVEYFDYSLARFFKRIEKEEWYKNTLFVITADHTGPNTDSEKSSVLDDYRIPIAFFKPGGSLKASSRKIASQIDILPSVLHLINYKKPFYSQGQNLFDDKCGHFSVDYNSGIYQYIDSAYCYRFNGQKGMGFYNWKMDPDFKNDLSKQQYRIPVNHAESNLKKFIQVFNNNMLENKMSVF